MKKKSSTKKKPSIVEAVAAELAGSLDNLSAEIGGCDLVAVASNESDSTNSKASGEVY